MKVNWYLKQKICLVGAIALSLCQGVSSFPADAVSLQETTILPQRFADWCLNKANLPPDTRHTVDVLLQEAGTQECDRADKQLSTLPFLSLNSNRITDLKPLSSLTNLTILGLGNNKIADLKPLSSLPNLTVLYLYKNQITDLKPLSSLTNLSILNLWDNKVADLKPLSSLTSLSDLDLSNNKITDIKPLSSLTNLSNLVLKGNPINR